MDKKEELITAIHLAARRTDRLEWRMNTIFYLLEQTHKSPKGNHNNWLDMKRKHGWIYSEDFNFNKKMHPDLVPYNRLSAFKRLIGLVEYASLLLKIRSWNKDTYIRNI